MFQVRFLSLVLLIVGGIGCDEEPTVDGPGDGAFSTLAEAIVAMPWSTRHMNNPGNFMASASTWNSRGVQVWSFSADGNMTLRQHIYAPGTSGLEIGALISEDTGTYTVASPCDSGGLTPKNRASVTINWVSTPSVDNANDGQAWVGAAHLYANDPVAGAELVYWLNPADACEPAPGNTEVIRAGRGNGMRFCTEAVRTPGMPFCRPEYFPGTMCAMGVAGCGCPPGLTVSCN